MTLELETPPEGFEITREWQPLPDSFRHWTRVLWCAVAGEPTTKRIPFTCGAKTGKLRKSWGKGNNRGQFIFMEMPEFTIVMNYRTKQIKIK